MNEEEFLKEHPSLKDKLVIYTLMGNKFPEELVLITNIHETQLDKQKLIDDIKELSEHKYIEEAREEYLKDLKNQNVPYNHFNPSDFLMGYHKALQKLKKRLGI